VSGPRRTIAAFPASGFVPEPPVERSEAEGAYGAPLPDAAWSDIVRAFHDHGGRLNAMDGPGVNKNRNDPEQYHAGRQAAEIDMVSIHKMVVTLAGKHALVKSMTLASLGHPDGATSGVELAELLRTIEKASRRASQIVSRAGIIPAIKMSDASSRRQLARDIVAALSNAGLVPRFTHWEDEVSYSGMTPAEHLLGILEVHPEESPNAFVKWVRDSLKQVSAEPGAACT
jgi:hypothetical protein